MLTRRDFALGVGAMLAAGPARAQNGNLASSLAEAIEDRPIHILVGYPPGGGVDLVARLLGEPMRATFGQTVSVENGPGASAMLAAQDFATATPDGYTLLASAAGEIATNQHLYKDRMTYDPLRQLAPIALFGIVPCVVGVAATTPVHTPAELIAYARANRGKLSFSSSGVGNPQQLTGEMMNAMAGTDVLHVPYRGSAPAVTDVAVGAVTMSFSSLAAALPMINAGQLRAVAVTSRDRMPQLPDVASFAESVPELKDYELLNWFGFFATGGTPEPVVTRLNAIANTMLRDKAVVAKLEVQGIVARPMTPAEFKTFVAEEAAKFGKVIAQANIRAEDGGLHERRVNAAAARSAV